MTVAIEKHTSQSSSQVKGNSLFYNKVFFGKTSCLKITQNTSGDVYFGFGLQKDTAWSWKKVKFSDAELGQIISVLSGEKDSVSFFHNFNDDKTQIWITRKENSVNFKTKHSSRSLVGGELKVLEILLTNCILRSCMNF